MSKKILYLTLAMAMFLSCLSGCGQSGGASGGGGGTLIFAQQAEFKSIDPNNTSESYSSPILRQAFVGLYKTASNGDIEPAMAKEYKVSDDGTVYTFTLKDGLKWSNGSDLKASDFEFGWKRAMTGSFASEQSYMIVPYIKNGNAYFTGACDWSEVGVKATGDKTLEVTLEAATPFFPQLLTTWVYSPVCQAVVEGDEKWATKADTYVCNGPFKISEIKTGDSVTMVPNEHYYAKENVKLDSVVIRIIKDMNTSTNAVENGDIQGAFEVPSSEVARLKNDPKGIYSSFVNLHLTYYNFNTQKAPFDDVRVRKALVLAIDRQRLLDQVLQQDGQPATGIVSSGIVINGKDFRNDYGKDYDIKASADIETAKQLLADAGYPNGEGFPVFSLKFFTRDDMEKVTQAMQQMWKENLGIDCEISNKEWVMHREEMEVGDFDVACTGYGADYPHPMSFLEAFTSDSSMNFCGFKNEQYDNLLLEASTTDVAVSLEKMHAAEDLLMENYPVIPLYYRSKGYLMSPSVKDYYVTSTNDFFFENAYIEK